MHVANLDGTPRAILILAGRSLNGPRREGRVADFLEGSNADLDFDFESRPANATFNDRIVVVAANP